MQSLKKFFSLEAWQWRIGRRIRPLIRANWPAPRVHSTGERPRIAVVTVNYNTKELLARLIFSLRRFVDDSVNLGPIIVVDNNSTDGSVEMIIQLSEAGLITPIFNKKQTYHGPGLNQGMELLRAAAAQGKPGFVDIDYVFVVDSDVFVSRGELFTDAITAMQTVSSPISGEFEPNEYIEGGYSHISSLLIDPAITWRKGFHPFEDHGVPALEYQRTIVKHRLPRLDFPFRSHFYLIHLWSGTLKAICSANETDNKCFAWAMADLPVRPSMDEKTQFIIEEFEQCFRASVPTFLPEVVLAACAKPERLRLKRPYEMAPEQRFTPSGQIADAGFVAR